MVQYMHQYIETIRKICSRKTNSRMGSNAYFPNCFNILYHTKSEHPYFLYLYFLYFLHLPESQHLSVIGIISRYGAQHLLHSMYLAGKMTENMTLQQRVGQYHAITLISHSTFSHSDCTD